MTKVKNNPNTLDVSSKKLPTLEASGDELLAGKLAKTLANEFALSKWEVGDKIPTELELCRDHNISRTTVRSAMACLESLGFINRVRGKGTFLVAKPGEKKLEARPSEILFIVPMDFQDRQTAQQYMGFNNACEKFGYKPYICSMGRTYESERKRLAELDPAKYLGACITPHWGYKNLEAYFELKKRGFPFVLMSRVPGLEVDSVSHDDRKRYYAMTNHLTGLGHRKIGLMKGPDSIPSEEGMLGYIEALGDAGIPYDRKLVYHPTQTEADETTTLRNGYAAAKTFLEMNPRPTAIVAESDEAAVGLICAFREKGYRVPEDIAVMGSGDQYEPGEAIMPLTTMQLSLPQVATKAVEILLWRIENPDAPLQQVFFPAELVVRESTIGKK
jgi:DNA-binding LacI/PurR family transcriptional regulator